MPSSHFSPLHPTQLTHGPTGVPHLDHVCDLIVGVHGQDIDIVGVRGLVGGWHRAAFAHMGGVVGGKKHRFALGLVIALGMQFIVGTGCGDGAK